MAEQNIEPFAYQKSTNINEHNQMVDKINELVDGTNELDNKRVNAVAQSFDDETRILATTLKTVDGTEISGSVYVPGGGDGGDIVIQNMKYNDKIIPVFDGFFNNLAMGNYNCGFELNVKLLSTSDGKTVIFTATELELFITNNTKFVAFKGTGTSAFGPVGNVVLTKYITDEETSYSGSVSIYRKVLDEYDWVDFSIDTTQIIDVNGYLIKGIKGAAITPYTASTGIKIDDENSTIAVDTDVIATVDSVNAVDTKADTAKTTADTAKTTADTANTNALKAYKSAYVENNTMTFEKGNGDTDTVALPTGGSYTAGDGITISDNEIAVDTNTIATTAVTTELASGISTNRNLINGTFDDVNISGSHLVFDKVNGEQKEIEIPSSESSEWVILNASTFDYSKIKLGTEIIIGSLTQSQKRINNAHMILYPTTSNYFLGFGSGVYATTVESSSFKQWRVGVTARITSTSIGFSMGFSSIPFDSFESGPTLTISDASFSNCYIKY